MYHFNYIYFHLLNVICTTVIKIHSLVYEIGKFKHHRFVSQVGGQNINSTKIFKMLSSYKYKMT